MWSSNEESQSPTDLKGFLSTLHAVSVRNLALDTFNVEPTMSPAYQPFLPSVFFELTAILPPGSEDQKPAVGSSPSILGHPKVKQALKRFSLHSLRLETASPTQSLQKGKQRRESTGTNVSTTTKDSEESDDDLIRTCTNKVLDYDGALDPGDNENGEEPVYPYERGLSLDSDMIEHHQQCDSVASSNEWSQFETPHHSQSFMGRFFEEDGMGYEQFLEDKRVMYTSEDVAGTSNPDWLVPPRSFKNILNHVGNITEFQITFFKDGDTNPILDFQVNIQGLTPLGVGLHQLTAIPQGAVFFRLSSSLPTRTTRLRTDRRLQRSAGSHPPGLYVTPWLKRALGRVAPPPPLPARRSSVPYPKQQASDSQLKTKTQSRESSAERTEQVSLSSEESNLNHEEARLRREYREMTEFLRPVTQRDLERHKLLDQKAVLLTLLKKEKELLMEEEREAHEQQKLLRQETQELQDISIELQLGNEDLADTERLIRSEREQLVNAHYLMNCQQIKLINYLQYIYPIESIGEGNFSIGGLEIPSDASAIFMKDDEHISTALGFVCHTVTMLSKYLQIPLPNKIMFNASRSMVCDQLFSGTEFPLFKRGVEKDKLERGLQLLDRNLDEIMQKKAIFVDPNTPMLKKLKKLYSATSSYAASNQHLPDL